MAFSTSCTNKGCGKTQEPYIDLTDDKVYCSECNKEILNLSPFTKNLMKSMKQIKKKVVAAFSVKCGKCGKEAQPKLNAKDDVICGLCNKVLDNLSIPFRNMLKEKLKTTNKDV